VLFGNAVPRILPALTAVTALLTAASGIPSAAALTLPLSPPTPPFNSVHSVAASTTGVPQEYTFDVSVAGSYSVTLIDLGKALTPSAPLASVKLAVTNATALVGPPLAAPGTLTLSSLATGTYALHVIGMPGNTPGSGPFGIQVSNASMTVIASFQGTLALPSQALPNGEAVLDSSLQVPTSGSYTVTLTDLQLPQPLTTLTLLLIAQGGQTPVAVLPSGGSFTTNVMLTAGVTYDVFAVGKASAAANAGLFGVTVVRQSDGTLMFGRAVPVGSTMLVGSPTLMAGNDTFSLTDLKYPAALSQLGAVLTLDGQVEARIPAAPGSQPFVATAGTYAAFAVATAPSSPGAGTYSVQVLPASGPPLFSAARAVTATGSALSAYSFDTSLPSAGTYTVSLTDFQFPAALNSLSLATVQDGTLLGTPLSSAGNLNINGASGALSLILFAQAAAATSGLFGITVTSGGPNSVFDVTQAVGALFTAEQFSIVTAGRFSVTATDLGFPANFANYDTIVTQGAKQVGSIFGGGTFNFNATPGNYFLNFVAQPSGADQAGTYALSVITAPPAPTVSLSADHMQVGSGGTVDLIWSSQNATSCTASGGWSGNEPLSGTLTSPALTSNTTFTLTCTGAGGNAAQSVMITVTAASGGGGGGGGSFEVALLMMLSTLLLGRLSRDRGRPTFVGGVVTDASRVTHRLTVS